MARPLRVAFLKPEHGVAGGLESVVERLERILRTDRHEVARLSVDMRPSRRAVAGLDIPPAIWDAAPEYFPYLAGRDGFDRLDTRRYDLVISTQAPSFAARHPRHLSVFYHHHRVYYDLEDLYVRAGFAADPDAHREAGKLVRELDQPRLEEVGWFLAGSATVADRLARFNGLTDVSVLHAGRIVGPADARPTGHQDDADGATVAGSVLCVGRHEFPKRAELVVAAAHLVPHLDVAVVGGGGREAWARLVDARIARGELDPERATAEELWCNIGRTDGDGAPAATAGVEITGRVADDDLARRYAEAAVVVAPAYDEDYGLTAIEAMALGKPVIVCSDGGGLTELVEHERTGLVVEPTPAAIAAAVERLTVDRSLAAELGRNGRARADQLSWATAADELRAGIAEVLG